MAKKIGSLKLYLIIAVIGALFIPPFAKYQELRHKSRMLDKRIAELKLENKRYEEEKVKLETDITYIEKRAREKVGMVRKGEIVMKDSASNRGSSTR